MYFKIFGLYCGAEKSEKGNVTQLLF